MNVLLNRRKLIYNKLLFIFLIFIAICTISIFYALDQSISISKVKTLILIYIVMISLVNYIDDYDKLRKTIIYFVYSGLLASIYILVNSDLSQVTRFGRILGNVNAIGMIIGISATFCYYIILIEKKYLYLPFLTIMILTILLTGSRKSLLFIIMNVIIISYLRNRNGLKNKFKFAVIAIMILFITYYLLFNIPFFYQIIGIRVETMLDFVFGEGTNEGSINTRAYMIQVGIEFIKNKPLTGYGINNYRVLYSSVLGGRDTYAHNNYIELMVDTGIFGVLIYYLIHVIMLKNLLKSSSLATNKTIYFVFAAIIISYMVLALSLVYYDSKHFSFVLTLASIITNIVIVDKSNKIENSKEKQISI